MRHFRCRFSLIFIFFSVSKSSDCAVKNEFETKVIIALLTFLSLLSLLSLLLLLLPLSLLSLLSTLSQIAPRFFFFVFLSFDVLRWIAYKKILNQKYSTYKKILYPKYSTQNKMLCPKCYTPNIVDAVLKDIAIKILHLFPLRSCAINSLRVARCAAVQRVP